MYYNVLYNAGKLFDSDYGFLHYFVSKLFFCSKYIKYIKIKN